MSDNQSGMRVIVLNDYGFVNGGAAKVALDSLNPLAQHGVEVRFLFAVGPCAESINSEVVDVVDLGGQDLLNLPKWQAAVSGIYNKRAADQFNRILTQYEPENTIVHAHSWSKALSASVIRTALVSGFHVVCTLHDYFSVCPNGGLYDYQKGRTCHLAPMSRECICTNCDSRSYAHKTWRVSRQVVQDRYVKNGVRNFISVSDYSERLLRRWLPEPVRFFRVRNPVTISRDAPVDVTGNDDFAFIGRLSPEKGAALFAQAAKIAHINAVLAGTGDEETVVRQINPAARLLGWRDGDGVRRTLSRSRAVVVPSLWYETQGMVTLEAAASGVPAIVSDGCAATDYVEDGKTGLLFKSGDPRDLAQKLRRMADDDVLARRLGKGAYEKYWEDPPTTQTHVEELLSCYEAILAH